MFVGAQVEDAVSLGEAHDQVLACLPAPRKTTESLVHLDIAPGHQRRPELGHRPADRGQVFFQELEEKEAHILKPAVRGQKPRGAATFGGQQPHTDVLQRV